MARKGGLGKGLDALIPAGEGFSDDREEVLQIAVDEIIPNPLQPRKDIEPDSLQDLAASIRAHGILQPLVVSAGGTGYILIAGERRLRAARLAGLKTVPALLRSASEQQRLEMALIENVQRADLSPLETAEAYRMLSEQFSLAHEEIAERVGRSRASVTNTLRLLKLSEPVRRALADGLLSEGHARALLGLPSAAAQNAALQTVLEKNYSVRETEELVRRLQGERPPAARPVEADPVVTDLEERLRASLGTRVQLRPGRRGGRLVIHYYSNEELDGLLKHLLKD